jgi:hypothetical protein
MAEQNLQRRLAEQNILNRWEPRRRRTQPQADGCEAYEVTIPEPLAAEVQRYLGAKGFILAHAQEVQMQDLLLERMALHVAQQGLLGLAVDLELNLWESVWEQFCIVEQDKVSARVIPLSVLASP